MSSSPQALGLNRKSLAEIRRLFKDLHSPGLEDLHGIYQAEFVGPLWLRHSAGPAIALGGMPGWWGKEFGGVPHGFNLVRRGGRIRRDLGLRLARRPSLLDGRDGLCLVYATGSPFPWSLVIDELRWLDQDCLLGMTVVDRGALRHAACPFLLHARGGSDGL